jgi:hypothetical protein
MSLERLHRDVFADILRWTWAPHLRLVCHTWDRAWAGTGLANLRAAWDLIVSSPALVELYANLAPRITHWLCEHAAAAGSLEVLWLARRSDCHWGPECYHRAAHGGHLHVLQWLRAEGCPWRWAEMSCYNAVRGGHPELLPWIQEHMPPCDWMCPETFLHAARGGHLLALQWLYDRGCPWNSKACEEAARSGHLQALQWLRAHGCPWDANTCSMAAT